MFYLYQHDLIRSSFIKDKSQVSDIRTIGLLVYKIAHDLKLILTNGYGVDHIHHDCVLYTRMIFH